MSLFIWTDKTLVIYKIVNTQREVKLPENDNNNNSRENQNIERVKGKEIKGMSEHYGFIIIFSFYTEQNKNHFYLHFELWLQNTLQKTIFLHKFTGLPLRTKKNSLFYNK